MQSRRPGYACSGGRFCIFAAHKRWGINGWPLNMLEINPALVFSLAVATRNEAQLRLPPDPGELRQRELAFHLRFPESEAVVRILRKIPPPPVPSLPGVVEPLDSAEQLMLEGRQQSNCVASYAPRVREGRVFIYRVLQPERATLSLIRTQTGRWEIGELKASRNRLVTEQTHDLVDQWLGDWQLSCHR